MRKPEVVEMAAAPTAYNAGKIVARFGDTNVFSVISETPWELPIDALVLPVDIKGEPIGFPAENLKKFAASEWKTITKLLQGRKPPSIVPFKRKTGPLTLLCVDRLDGNALRIETAVAAVVSMAKSNGLREVALPLISTDTKRASDSAAAVLATLQRVLPASGLRTLFVVTISDPAAAVVQKIGGEIARERAPAKKSTVSPATSSAARSRRLSPALELANDHLAKQGLKLDDGMSTIVTYAGNLVAVRDRDAPRGALTSSPLLFALIELGTSAQARSDRALLSLVEIADAVGRPEKYPEVVGKYLNGGIVPAAADTATSLVSGLSPNVRKILDAAGKHARAYGHAEIGPAAFVLALLQAGSGNFARHLASMGLPRQRLLDEWNGRLLELLQGRREIEVTPPLSDPDAPAEMPVLAGGPDPPVSPMASGHFASAYTTDNPGASPADYINIGQEVQAFAYLAADKNIEPPISIGVFGEWGSGKTFFMDRMHEKIEKIATAKSYSAAGLHKNIVQIRFNAWHYIETNLWASLVEFIFSELDRWLRAHDKSGAEINALFEKLATSKQLRLEAVADLIASRRRLRQASEDVKKARDEYDKALGARAPATPRDVLAAAAGSLFGGDKGQDIKQALEGAAADLGVARLQQSSVDLTRLVGDSRDEAARARLLVGSLVARLGDLKVAIPAIGAVLAAPLLFEGLRQVLAVGGDFAWARDFNAGVLAVTSFVATAIAAGRVLLDRGIKGLAVLDDFRDALDQRIAEQTQLEKQRLAAAEQDLSKSKQAVSDAERQLSVAADQAAAAEVEFLSDTARGRLNRFIREKVASGGYAKHLGIIATIRKDFEQLADIMNQKGKAETERRPNGATEAELDKLKSEYQRRIGELLNQDDNRSLFVEKELDDLQHEHPKEKLRFFDRIVLYIDDLDRCPPKKVAEVLQAIHMLLFFRLFVVVVAVDARWIERALETEFPHLLRKGEGAPRLGTNGRNPREDTDRVEASELASGHDSETATAQDYLEKIFQIPFWVRRMDAGTSRDFVKGLAAKTVASAEPSADAEDPGDRRIGGDEPKPVVSPEPTEGGDPIVQIVGEPEIRPPAEETEVPKSDGPVEPDAEGIQITRLILSAEEAKLLEEFAPYVGGSPRRAKRFVNIYHLLKTALGGGAQPSADARVTERALIVALAVVTGAPYSASAFFHALEPRRNGSHATVQDYDGLDAVIPRLEPPVKLGRDLTMRDLVEHLVRLNRKAGITTGAEMTLALHKLGPEVQRYSFERVG